MRVSYELRPYGRNTAGDPSPSRNCATNARYRGLPPPKKNPDMGRVGEELIFGILKSALILGGVRVSNDGGVRCGIGVCQGHIPTILMKFSSPSLHNLARVLLQAEILYIVSITI